MQTYEKHFPLAMDEMKIRSELVSKKDTGELTGFCNLGQVNHDLEKLSDSLTSITIHKIHSAMEKKLTWKHVVE